MLNHRKPKAMSPKIGLRSGRNHRRRKAPVICRLPRPQCGYTTNQGTYVQPHQQTRAMAARTASGTHRSITPRSIGPDGLSSPKWRLRELILT
jgi:hypothetical protein